MRVSEKDVQKTIATLLTNAGFNVVASEQEEGFSRPAVFVNVYPATIELQGPLLEAITDTVEIKYIPSVETVENCADAAQEIRNLFMYKPFEVCDRKLTIQRIEFDIEKYVLFSWFDVEYIQETPNQEEYEITNDLELGGDF